MRPVRARTRTSRRRRKIRGTPRRSRDTSDRKSTRLNSSHDQISYAVFCLKKKKRTEPDGYEGKNTHRDRIGHQGACADLDLTADAQTSSYPRADCVQHWSWAVVVDVHAGL